MKGKIYKYLNNNVPDSFKKVFSKYIRNKVIKNPVFLSTVKEIKDFEISNKYDKEKIHFEKVKSMLIYSYENIKFYKEQFDKVNFNPYKFKDYSQMRELPKIDKNIIRENFNDFISNKNIDFYHAYTGGSTGKPMEILLDTNSIYKEKAFIYSYWSKLGYDFKKSKTVTFRGIEFGEKLYKYNPIDNQVIMNPFRLNQNNIYKYVKVFDKYNPQYVHGYPSAIYNFCKLLDKNNITIKSKINGVFFVSENLNHEEKEYIENVLNCKSLIFYGHSERAVFAEWNNDSYEFNKIYTHVEYLDTDEKDIYNLAITGLINYKMPLINYVPDDKVYIKDDKINIYGHWDKEMLIGKNSERISIASINFHSDVFNKINRYQFEQNEKGKVLVKIMPDEEVNQDDINLIKYNLNKKLKDIIELELVITDNIPLTNRGKHKKIIQNIKEVF